MSKKKYRGYYGNASEVDNFDWWSPTGGDSGITWVDTTDESAAEAERQRLAAIAAAEEAERQRQAAYDAI